MSECSKYQLLLQTDYVRLGEKYDHLYVYSHILSYIAFTEWSPLFLETKDSCPVEWSDGCCKTIAPCETGWQKLDGFLLPNVRILVPSSALTAVVRQLLPAKQWLTETRRVSTVKCENSCPVISIKTNVYNKHTSSSEKTALVTCLNMTKQYS
jgi:hypothetical protein